MPWVAWRAQVAAMFPDEAFHIGGDEWWPAWSNAPAVQAFMGEQGFANVVDVYHYYERRMIDIVRGLGRTTYAWEDINGACGGPSLWSRGTA